MSRLRDASEKIRKSSILLSRVYSLWSNGFEPLTRFDKLELILRWRRAVRWPLAARAQQSGNIARVGHLWHAGRAGKEELYFVVHTDVLLT